MTLRGSQSPKSARGIVAPAFRLRSASARSDGNGQPAPSPRASRQSPPIDVVLRLLDCAELRVKDLHFDRGELTIRAAKGGKDRVPMLPAALNVQLRDHLVRVTKQHDWGLAYAQPARPGPGPR